MSSAEKDIEKLKPELIGKTLTNLFHTKLSERNRIWQGSGRILYFRTILEINNSIHYDLWKSYLSIWVSDEELFPITQQNWEVPETVKFIGQKIKDIIVFNAQIYIILENDMAIEHTIDYGDIIKIKPVKELIQKAF